MGRYLVGKVMGLLEIFVEAKGDKFIEFSDDTVVLRLFVTVASRVSRADLTEVLGVRLVEVGSANPKLVESAEMAAKLVEFIGVVIEWVLRGPWGCRELALETVVPEESFRI